MASQTMTIEEMMNHPLTSKIFPEHYPFYVDDEKAKKEFEEKFIAYFYYREIGFETPFMFKQRLQTLLMMRMPYWKQLYETELEAKNINFLLNKDLKETFIRDIETENKTLGSNDSQQTSTNTNSLSQSASSDGVHKESAIRDGISQSSLNDGYLTGTSSDEDHTTTSSSSQSSDNINISGTVNQSGNEKVLEKTELISQGNIGITSSAQLLKEWREVLINMDEIIINECKSLFLKIY